MNVKRILLIGLILVAVAASLSIVSADNSVKVGGIDFNIPDDLSENEAMAKDGVNSSYPTKSGEISGNVSLKQFDKQFVHLTVIVYEFDSPDDAKKVQDAHKSNFNGTAKTINGHDGIYYKDNLTYGFCYCKDKCFIKVESNNDSLFESIIPK